jgi:hypothetical protein
MYPPVTQFETRNRKLGDVLRSLVARRPGRARQRAPDSPLASAFLQWFVPDTPLGRAREGDCGP